MVGAYTIVLGPLFVFLGVERYLLGALIRVRFAFIIVIDHCIVRLGAYFTLVTWPGHRMLCFHVF